MSEDRTGQGESIDLYARGRAYELVRAALSNNHDRDHGAPAARSLAAAVLAEAGTADLAEVAVDLPLRLASAVERIAADQGWRSVRPRRHTVRAPPDRMRSSGWMDGPVLRGTRRHR